MNLQLNNLLSLYTAKAFSENMGKTLIILVIAIVARFVSTTIVKAIVKKFQDGDPSTDTPIEKRSKTLGKIMQNTIDLTMFGIVVVSVLSQWGFDIRPLLTGAGIVGLAVGFGAQTLVKDVVTGFFILLENQFNTGDRITVSGIEGKVIDMKLRTTVVKDTKGNIHTVPNSTIGIVTKHKEAQVEE